MDVKNVDVSRFVDQASKAAHERIERVHGRVAKIEEGLGDRVEASSEHFLAKFESRAQAFSKYIEANPVKATMVAFGIGMWASRVFRSMEHTGPDTDPGAQAEPAGTTQEPKVGKAA